ncbi:MAG: hypothetical protein HYZ94_02090 [Candidatus Omnitrophica bacterium]|nr:hypothetical protein [Candidatus Omnitrophota bacterium]
MAGWLEKLRGIVDIKVKIDLRGFRLFNITVNQNAPLVDDRKQAVNINLGNLDPRKRAELLSSVRDAILKEDFLLLESSAEITVEDIKQVESSVDFQQVIQTLSPYVLPSDIPILKAALYLRKKYQEGSSPELIQILKGDIVERYGTRGGRIANLCSAGYLEDMILPLLKEMQSAPDVKDEFKKSYETIIAESGFAVFVNLWMGPEQIKAAVKQRIVSNCKYGKMHLHIHGIGRTNISKIRACIDELLVELPGLEKTIDKTVGTAIYLRLEFRPELVKALSEEGNN